MFFPNDRPYDDDNDDLHDHCCVRSTLVDFFDFDFYFDFDVPLELAMICASASLKQIVSPPQQAISCYWIRFNAAGSDREQPARQMDPCRQ